MNDLSLDAREVLAHLNNLGYRNISAQQLKEFIKDLKKLIKYESRFGPYQSNRNFGHIGKTCVSPEKQSSPMVPTDKKIYDSKTSSPKFSPSSLSLPLYNRNLTSPKLNNKRKSTSTSITPRDYAKNVRIYRNVCTSPIRTPSATNFSEMCPQYNVNSSSKCTSSRLASPTTKTIYPQCQRRSRSALGRDNCKQLQLFPRSRSACSNRTHIKPKVPRECNMERPQSRKSVQLVPQNKPLKADPVQLYQYYKSEWERFKNNTPGESPRSHLRWKIHQKILKTRQ